VEPTRSYVICCVQRTGSWLLAHTLADTGYAGRPSDYFDEAERQSRTREWNLPSPDLACYVQAVQEKATTPNGVFGSKIMWNDFDRLRSSDRTAPGPGAGADFMGSTFAAARYVWLRREDKVRQGISWWRAGVTGQWALRAEQDAGQPTAPDVERIVPLVRFAQQCEDGWRQWFASTGIQPCEVTYEELARDRFTIANKVLGFLRLPLLAAGSLPPVRYRKQADSLTDSCVDIVRSAMIASGLPGRSCGGHFRASPRVTSAAAAGQPFVKPKNGPKSLVPVKPGR
jgi:trehalose 2-sulfotransferase